MEDKNERETEVVKPIPVTNESTRKRRRCLLLLLLLLLLLASSAVIAGVLLSDLEQYDSQDYSRTSISTFTEIENSTNPTSAYDYTSNYHFFPLTSPTNRGEKSADQTTNYQFTSDTFATTTLKVDMTSAPVSAQNVTIGSRGRAFIVVFMTNIASSIKNIYVTSEDVVMLNMSTSVNLASSLKMQIDRTMKIHSHKKITVPTDIELAPLKKEFKAILITTSNDVFLISHDKFVPPAASVGSTAHIPLHKLSTKYIVISTQPEESYWMSHFAVGVVEENTLISITFKMKSNLNLRIDGNNYYNGDVFNLTLDKLQTYEIQHITDLSGTVIESSDPIAAFSGNDCNTLNGFGGCDHLIEQLPPVNSLDNKFIVPPNSDHRDTKIRITATEDTNITYKINGIMQTAELYKLVSMDTLITSNQVCTIESKTPIIVTSFGLHSKLSGMGDPSMTIVPGLQQYLNYYKIVVPSGYVHNYVSITIALSARNSFRVNGATIWARNIVFEKNVSIGTALYNVRIIKVGEGELTASSISGDSFSLMFTGTKDSEAYGFSGNSLLL